MRTSLKVIAVLALLVVLAGLSTPFLLKTIYPLKYENSIEEYSTKYNLDKYLVMGVISAESRFSEDAVSPKSAKGLMQLKDDTAYWCAEKYGIQGEIYEAEVNIEIGCAYLRYLLDIFGQDTENALAAYNAGQGNVKKWLADQRYSTDGKNLDTIPYTETRDYVLRVERRARIYKKLYGN